MIAGLFHLDAVFGNHKHVVTDFGIRVELREGYPVSLPVVYETCGRIPKTFHKNAGGQSLCLGVPVLLYRQLKLSPSVLDYLKACLVPYLYQAVFFERGDPLPLGEIAHGSDGVLDFYALELHMPSHAAVIRCIQLLGMPRLTAYEEPCPCNSGRLLRQCHSHFLDKFREYQSEAWFRRRSRQLVTSAG